MTLTRRRIIDATTPGVPRGHDLFNVNGPSALPAPLLCAPAGEDAPGVTEIAGP